MISSMGPPPPPPPRPPTGPQRPSAAAVAAGTAWSTCDVCHGKIEAHHLNFGAVSCFSCKAFFRDNSCLIRTKNLQQDGMRKLQRLTRGRRSVQMGKHVNIHVGGLWRCRGTGACTIERETRIHCKLCRWNACLKAGMRPEFVHNSDAAVVNIRSQAALSRGALAMISPGLGGGRAARASPRPPDKGEVEIEKRHEEEGATAGREVLQAPPIQPQASSSPPWGDTQSPPTYESAQQGSPLAPVAMPSSPLRYRRNQTSVRKRMLAYLDHVHRTWVLATKTVRSSREFVHALLALHSGYPDLMRNELFEDHLRALGNLFGYFAHLQPEFGDLSPAEQRTLLARNTPLFLQYIVSGYLKSESGCEQVKWMLVGKNPAQKGLHKINMKVIGELANVSESEPIGRYEDSMMKISHLNIELLPMTALAYLYNGCSEEHLADIFTLFEWSEYTMGRGTTRKALEKMISDSNAANSEFEMLREEQQRHGDYRNSRLERIFTPPTEAERLVVARYLGNLQDLCNSVAVENEVIVQYVQQARFPNVQNDRRSLIAMRNSVAGVLLERIKRLSRGCFQAVSAESAARLQMNYMNGLALYGTSLQFSDHLQAQMSVLARSPDVLRDCEDLPPLKMGYVSAAYLLSKEQQTRMQVLTRQVLELIRDPEGFTLFLMIILSDGIDVNQSLQHQYANMYLRRHTPLALLGSGRHYENDTMMLANGIAQVKELGNLLQILLKGGTGST